MAVLIKSEPSDFTDLSNSGFMSDGGYSTLSQYQTPSKLKTLSFRILRGEDKWPTPCLKWICCIAVGKLSGNYLHLCWISAKKCRKKLQLVCDNPPMISAPDIINGNDTEKDEKSCEISEIDIAVTMQDGNTTLIPDEDLKNRNTSEFEPADPQNGNDEPASNGNLKHRNDNDQIIKDSPDVQNGNGDLKDRNDINPVAEVLSDLQNGNDESFSSGDLKNRNNTDQPVKDWPGLQKGNTESPSKDDLKNRSDTDLNGMKSKNNLPGIAKTKGDTEVNAGLVLDNREILANDDSDSDTIEYMSDADNHPNEQNGNSSSDSTLYGYKRVNRSCKKTWMKEAQTVKLSVNIFKLSSDIIALYTKKKDFHPYSNVEEYSESENIVNKQDDPTDTSVKTGYSMRPRKREKSTVQTRLSHRKRKSTYTDMWYDDLSLPPSPKRKRKDYVGLKGPSSAHIRSRNTRTVAPKHTIPLDYVVKEINSDGEKTMDTQPDQSKKDDINKVTNDNVKPNTGLKPILKVPKGLFKKTTHGIKKHRRIRNYKCPKCNICKNLQAEANEHYKNNHPPVSCSKCPKVCATPCTLARHMYVHSDLKYSCHRCEQRFAFESELKVHKFKHRRIRMFKCSDSGCTKSYFSKGELTQHAKVHDNIDHNCTHDNCDYSSQDICLLRSHERSHKDFFKFYCCICQKGFKYHTQWKWHTVQMGCTIPILQH